MLNIVVEDFPNDPHRKKFHVNQEVWQLTPKIQELNLALARIPGVDEYEREKSTVCIKKGMAYSWEEVEPAVMAALRTHL